MSKSSVTNKKVSFNAQVLALLDKVHETTLKPQVDAAEELLSVVKSVPYSRYIETFDHAFCRKFHIVLKATRHGSQSQERMIHILYCIAEQGALSDNLDSPFPLYKLFIETELPFEKLIGPLTSAIQSKSRKSNQASSLEKLLFALFCMSNSRDNQSILIEQKYMNSIASVLEIDENKEAKIQLTPLALLCGLLAICETCRWEDKNMKEIQPRVDEIGIVEIILNALENHRNVTYDEENQMKASIDNGQFSKVESIKEDKIISASSSVSVSQTEKVNEKDYVGLRMSQEKKEQWIISGLTLWLYNKCCLLAVNEVIKIAQRGSVLRRMLRLRQLTSKVEGKRVRSLLRTSAGMMIQRIDKYCNDISGDSIQVLSLVAESSVDLVVDTVFGFNNNINLLELNALSDCVDILWSLMECSLHCWAKLEWRHEIRKVVQVFENEAVSDLCYAISGLNVISREKAITLAEKIDKICISAHALQEQ
ncbi:uncharacterized protein MONOS_17266 [Monocercomonoides exilis]|uniref:uncharacterized protein n=1 Tax=Monocercomonoides exilis TaxID=2049356 RepID=UPI0035596BBE|nr:hypothetical protein MONOS_17266 [Monocercomonoides exilis]